DYKVDMHNLPVGQRRFLRGIVHAMDPGYDENQYSNLKKYTDTSSTEHKVVTRAGEATNGTLQVLRAVNRTKETDPIPSRVLDAWLAGHISGDDRYDDIYNALVDMTNQFNAVLNLSGSPRVTTVHDMLAHLPRTASPRSIRRQMLNNASNIWQIMEQYQHDWELSTRRHTLNPAIQPKTWEYFSALIRMNP